jgi:hypothetical protein
MLKEGPVRIIVLSVAVKDPLMGLPSPGAERILMTSPGETRITPYGPEGVPGRIPPVVPVGAMPVITVSSAEPDVTVGRLNPGVSVGTAGVSEAVKVGVMVSGVGEAMTTGIGNAVGFPSNERLQPVSERRVRQNAKMKRVRFMTSPFGWNNDTGSNLSPSSLTKTS